MHAPWPSRVDVLGTSISRTSVDAIGTLLENRHPHRAVTVNVCNVHSVMTARNDARLAEALAAGDVNTPDGMPLVWVLRSLGHGGQKRVTGTDLTTHVLEHGISRSWRHFFYGSTPATLDRLVAALAERFPGVQVVGTLSPPFRPLSPAERATVIDRIRSARADIIWVGLGMPKQETWMHDMRDHLPGTVLVGIGAAFDFLAGTKPQAPRWMQEVGLEWLFRFGSEPRRLWRRYLWNNPAFLGLWMRQLAGSAMRPKATGR